MQRLGIYFNVHSVPDTTCLLQTLFNHYSLRCGFWVGDLFTPARNLVLRRLASLCFADFLPASRIFDTRYCGIVEDRKMMCTRGLRDYDWFYSLKILAHFRSKVLVDFHHSVTQINCLTGAIISETYIRHILRMNIDYTILHSIFYRVFTRIPLPFVPFQLINIPKRT